MFKTLEHWHEIQIHKKTSSQRIELIFYSFFFLIARRHLEKSFSDELVTMVSSVSASLF